MYLQTRGGGVNQDSHEEDTSTHTLTIASLVMDGILNQAYLWLRKQREHYSHNSSIWDILFNWTAIKSCLPNLIFYSQLKLKMHSDKTNVGCIKKSFDFLGVHFSETPSISKASLENHCFKLAQRYAQGAIATCIGDYIK